MALCFRGRGLDHRFNHEVELIIISLLDLNCSLTGEAIGRSPPTVNPSRISWPKY